MSKNRDLSKIRSDSIWNSLPAERRKIFEGWLFDERVSYAAARERAQKEWGVEGSLASVGRFYRRVERRRTVADLEAMADAAEKLAGTEGKLESLKASTMKVIGMQLLKKAVERDDVAELAAVGRVLTQTEDREIQRERLALAREKFEFQEAIKQAPLLDRMSREDARADEIRLTIFGKSPPGYADPNPLNHPKLA